MIMRHKLIIVSIILLGNIIQKNGMHLNKQLTPLGRKVWFTFLQCLLQNGVKTVPTTQNTITWIIQHTTHILHTVIIVIIVLQVAALLQWLKY